MIMCGTLLKVEADKGRKDKWKRKKRKTKTKKSEKKKLTWHNAMLTKATNYRLSLEFPEASLKLLSYFPFCRTEFMVAQNLWLHMTWITLCFRIELLPSGTWVSRGIFKVIKLFFLLPYRTYDCTWHESRCVSELNYYHLTLEFPEASLKLFPFCRTEFMVSKLNN